MNFKDKKLKINFTKNCTRHPEKITKKRILVDECDTCVENPFIYEEKDQKDCECQFVIRTECSDCVQIKEYLEQLKLAYKTV